MSNSLFEDNDLFGLGGDGWAYDIGVGACASLRDRSTTDLLCESRIVRGGFRKGPLVTPNPKGAQAGAPR